MENVTEELKRYIESVLKSVEDGVTSRNFLLDGSIEFDLAVSNISEGRGGLKLYVARAEGKLKAEEISKLKFKVRPNFDSILRGKGGVFSPASENRKRNNPV